MMVARNMRAKEVSEGSGIYTRTMSDILAGKRPSQRSLILLGEFFGVKPERILEDEYPWTVERQEAKVERIQKMRSQEGVNV